MQWKPHPKRRLILCDYYLIPLTKYWSTPNFIVNNKTMGQFFMYHFSHLRVVWKRKVKVAIRKEKEERKLYRKSINQFSSQSAGCAKIRDTREEKVSDSDKIVETGEGSEKINEGNYSFVVRHHLPSSSVLIRNIYELESAMLFSRKIGSSCFNFEFQRLTLSLVYRM